MHEKKEPFVSPGNKALFGTLITIGDVIDIFAIEWHVNSHLCCHLMSKVLDFVIFLGLKY